MYPHGFSKHINVFPQTEPDGEMTFKKFIKNVVDVLQLVSTNTKVVIGDCLIVCFKSLITGVKRRDLENFEQLSNSFKELLWYLSPHLKKLSARSLNICDILKPLALLNDPTRHAHKVGNISQEVLLSFVDAVNTHLEKSYTSHGNFKPAHDVIHNVIEIVISVKFSDYLTQAKNIMVDCHFNKEEPEYKKAVFSLPELETIDKYTTQREKTAILNLEEALKEKNFYEPISLDMHFTERASFCYVFICNLKKYRVSVQNCILFAQYMKGAQGNRYFMWREDQETEGYLTERTATIDSVIKMLPKYFSRVHKKKNSTTD